MTRRCPKGMAAIEVFAAFALVADWLLVQAITGAGRLGEHAVTLFANLTSDDEESA